MIEDIVERAFAPAAASVAAGRISGAALGVVTRLCGDAQAPRRDPSGRLA